MRFLLLAAALVACSGPKTPAPTTTGATTATGAGCPATAPAHGSPCARQNDKCSYANEPRCPFAFCADVASKLEWQTSFDHCPVACPPAKPTPGTSCSPISDQSCHYKVGDKCGFQVHCTATGWAEQELTLCDGM